VSTPRTPYPGHPKTARHLIHDTARSEKLWALRRAQGMDSSFIDSTSIALHLQRLHGWGMSDGTIARAAGLSGTTVRNTRIRAYPRCLRTVAAALSKVDHHPQPTQLCVLTVGAARRVAALKALGWTYSDLATQMGMASPQSLTSCLRGRSMTYRNWASITALYEDLAHVPGPSRTARQRAVRAGLVPPLGWEGRDIDHPEARPWTAADDEAPEPAIDDALLLRVLGLRTMTMTPREGYAIYLVQADANPVRVPARDRHLYVCELLARGWSRYEVQRALGTSGSTLAGDALRGAAVAS
jgi:lambda repressor-like predicted transcriptional regulator